MLQKPITYMYRVYITLPLQGRHKHLTSRSIHMDRIRIPPDTEGLGGRRTTIMIMTWVKIDIYMSQYLLSCSYYCYIVKLSYPSACRVSAQALKLQAVKSCVEEGLADHA